MANGVQANHTTKVQRKDRPHQFIMSYEAAVASTGGDDAVLAKSFVIAAEGDVLA